MDTLLKLLAVLTVAWAGWIYFQNSGSEAELKKVRNELKMAEEEQRNAQANYDEEVKKRDALAEEVTAIKEKNQELKKAIAAKKEEKRLRAIEERRERQEAEKKAREEEREESARELREAREAELEEERREEEEERKRLEAENAEMERESAEQERKREERVLKDRVDSYVRRLRSSLVCPHVAAPKKRKDYSRLMEKSTIQWTGRLQKCIDAALQGDAKKLETAVSSFRSLAKSLYTMSGNTSGCLEIAEECIRTSQDLMKERKRLEKLREAQ